MLDFFVIALKHCLELHNIMLMLLGVWGGVVIGALPGLTATMGIALLVPFTFVMPPEKGLILLGGLYAGAIYGGSIAAILINTPGTPSAIATTFDGHPMALKGEAEEALTASITGSFIGGIGGNIFLLSLSPLLAMISLKFGPPEMFWVAMLGLTIIATFATESLLKGFIGGLIGLVLATVGISPIAGESRFTFGNPNLAGGIELICALIGFFCIPQVIKMVESPEKAEMIKYKRKKGILFRLILRILSMPGLLIRSIVIGTFIGVVPGAGGNIAALVSYNEAMRWSKNPEKFGKGCIEGVVAPETANNAEVSGSLIPLLTLGIPGAPPAAVLLGALLIQGIRPGPELYTVHGEITYTFIISLFFSNFFMFLSAVFGARLFAKVMLVPRHLLAPVIVVLSVIGSYAIRNNMMDVAIMLGCGFAGYVGGKLGFHPAPIVLGLILGKIAEIGLVEAMTIGAAKGGWFVYFITRPLSAVLIVLVVFSAAWPIIRSRKKKATGRSGS